MTKSILVIGDSHAHPSYSNERFDWLGKMILEYKPDIIIDIGDFADMPSLSHHDMGKLKYEGRRYKKDVECVLDARKRVVAPYIEYNKKQKELHKKQYHPRLVALGGNHEDHIDRAVQYDSKLDGLISVDDLMYKELGWEYHSFGEIVEIEGIAFTHFFMGGVMGKPMGGLYPTANILKKYHTSCVQGHTHYFQMRHEQGLHGKIYAFMAGCYFDYNPDWTNAHIFYDRGILMLNGVNNGSIESFSWAGIEEIKRKYQ